MASNIQIELYYPIILVDHNGDIKSTEIFDNLNDGLMFLYDSLSNDTDINEGRMYKAVKNKRLGNLVNFRRVETIEIGKPAVKWYNEKKLEIETQMDREAINQKIKREELKV